MELFNNISIEKQTSILNAAFCCFGKNGYRKASIADVAAGARVSKASIFQYFGTKKELCLYLFNLAKKKMNTAMPMGTDDFFECISIAAEVKMQVLRQYPGMYSFLLTILTDKDEEISSELSESKINFIESDIFANVNWNKFKDGVDKAKLSNMVKWISDGYIKDFVALMNAENINKGLKDYLELIKKSFYKEEFLL